MEPKGHTQSFSEEVREVEEAIAMGGGAEVVVSRWRRSSGAKAKKGVVWCSFSLFSLAACWKL